MKKISTTTITKTKLELRKEKLKELTVVDMRQAAGGFRVPSGHSVCC